MSRNVAKKGSIIVLAALMSVCTMQMSTLSAKAAWTSDAIGWKYTTEDGCCKDKWVSISGKWYLFKESGYMATGWQEYNNNWYYLQSTGAMKTGWLQDGGNWYYLQSSGAMKTGWLQDGGSWYYLQPSGAMETGWLQDGNNWYYLQSSGAMKTGWLQDGGNWYYLQSSGTMKTGWLHDGKIWYYFDSDGKMACDEKVIINGNTYSFDKNGMWIEESKSSDTYENDVLAIVNSKRKSNNLSELTLDSTLCNAAQKRAEEIKESFSHTRPDGQRCFSILSQYAVLYSCAGENIAYGFSSAESVMDAWMNSKGHRDNILYSSFNKLGVGCFEYQGRKYWVQIFTG